MVAWELTPSDDLGNEIKVKRENEMFANLKLNLNTNLSETVWGANI